MTRPTDILVYLLTTIQPREKVYPDLVPANVELPYMRYTESVEPTVTYDGSGGDTTTCIVTVCAGTKAKARELADRIVELLDQQMFDTAELRDIAGRILQDSDGTFLSTPIVSHGYAFYCTGREYSLYDQDRVSAYDLTFKIL